MKTELMAMLLAAGAMPGAWADGAHGKVRLWEDGPFWAETNVGAENPEDSGYYFWWGDTIGYKWENMHWVASDGSAANFSGACAVGRRVAHADESRDRRPRQ